MALVPYVYLDDDLDNQLDDAVPVGIGAVLGSSGNGYFLIGKKETVGDPSGTLTLEANSDPGVDPISVSIDDASPGSGVEATHIKLALTEGGLASATPGAALNLGAAILNGAVNAVKVWLQWDNSTGGTPSTEISLVLSAIDERAT